MPAGNETSVRDEPMFIKLCPLGTGKWLLWKGGYYQDHFIQRNQLLGEFDSKMLAVNALRKALPPEEIQWVNKRGQDVYARTTRRWARITRDNRGWYVARGFYGDIKASYGDKTGSKSLALTIAEGWVLDQ